MKAPSFLSPTVKLHLGANVDEDVTTNGTYGPNVGLVESIGPAVEAWVDRVVLAAVVLGVVVVVAVVTVVGMVVADVMDDINTSHLGPVKLGKQLEIENFNINKSYES